MIKMLSIITSLLILSACENDKKQAVDKSDEVASGLEARANALEAVADNEEKSGNHLSPTPPGKIPAPAAQRLLDEIHQTHLKCLERTSQLEKLGWYVSLKPEREVGYPMTTIDRPCYAGEISAVRQDYQTINAK